MRKTISMPEKRFKALRRFNRAILNPITRLLTAGRVSFCSLIYHVGRRSGKQYAIPVKAVIKGEHIYIPLTNEPFQYYQALLFHFSLSAFFGYWHTNLVFGDNHL
jgi:hypothetical protein